MKEDNDSSVEVMITWLVWTVGILTSSVQKKADKLITHSLNNVAVCCVSGDLVVGLKPVNGNWWQGQKGHDTGIFPVTHVYELHVAGHDICHDAVPTTPTTPQPVPPSPKPAADNSVCVAKGRVNMDLSAQLDDELELHVGDVITITEVIDEDFAVGHCNGRTGQFPLGFVDIIEGEIKPPVKDKTPPVNKFSWWKNDSNPVQESVVKEVVAFVPAAASGVCDMNNSNPPISEFVRQQSLQTDHDMNTPSSVHSSITAERHPTRQDSVPHANTYTETELTPYGTTLFPFTAENPNELSFPADVIINLHRHIGSEWTEGEYDGKRGIFPTSFIQILVDCPTLDRSTSQPEGDPSQVLDTSTGSGGDTSEPIADGSVSAAADTEPSAISSPEDSGTNSDVAKVASIEEPAHEEYGRVLFDFKAESAKDLEMKEGDTVTILRRVDANWVEARHDDGRTGLVPVNYIEVIGMEPTPETPVVIKNGPKDGQKEIESDKVVQEPVVPCDVSEGVPVVTPTTDVPCAGVTENETENTPAIETHSSCHGDSINVSQSIVSPPSPSVPVSVNGTTPISSRTVAKPAVKPRLHPRPKPAPKPKPAVAAKPRAAQKPTIVPRRQATVDVPSSRPESSGGRLHKAVSLDTSLNDIIESEMRMAGGKSRTGSDSGPAEELDKDVRRGRHSVAAMEQSWHPMTSSVSSIMETEEEDAFTTTVPPTAPRPIPTRPPPPPPSACSPPSRPAITRPAPPRPTGPRVVSAPPRVPMVPSRTSKADSPELRPVPVRPAPRRPGNTPPNRPPSIRRKRNPGDLMDFSPESSLIGKCIFVFFLLSTFE